MIVFIRLKKLKIFFVIIVIILSCLLGIHLLDNFSKTSTTFANKDLNTELQEIFNTRNQALLEENIDILSDLYNKEVRNGLWAYEHELKKMECLKKWSNRQSVQFKKINSEVILRNAKEKEDGYSVNLLVSTEYQYIYQDDTEINNSFRIGTYHSLDLMKNKDKYIVTREWYTDPFADSLHLDEMESKEIKDIILSGKPKDLSDLSERRKKAVEYAYKYSGAANLPKYGFQYNSEYRDYNNEGGDCTNFASQVFYEGGDFEKNYTWNYKKGSGSKAWVNAQAFHNYMVYSGRASIIAEGSYNEVLKHSYKLLPGDYIAYKKKGKVDHISIVTDIDSKGYALVNSHNSDRHRVPWDLGWNDKDIVFNLVRVNY